jgi:hypothetical protein
MSVSRRNMSSDGIFYKALDLGAPLVLFQEACLEMKRQGTVHQVKYIHPLVALQGKKSDKSIHLLFSLIFIQDYLFNMKFIYKETQIYCYGRL